MWPASAARAADWPRLAEARGSLRRDLALRHEAASGGTAGRGLCHLALDTGGYALLGLVVLALLVIKCLTARKGSFKKAIGVQSSMY